MNYIFPIVTIISIIFLACVVFIGYYLYANMQRKESISKFFAQKESDIVDLYNSLEKMMEEIDRFVYQSKCEIDDERKKCLELYENIAINKSDIKLPKQHKKNHFQDNVNAEVYFENELREIKKSINREPIKQTIIIEKSENETLRQKVAGVVSNKSGRVG